MQLIKTAQGHTWKFPLSSYSLLNTVVLPIAVVTFGFWDECSDYLKSQSISSYQRNLVEDYDFIIIGSGSAGSVVANRLSANKNVRNILLLEIGGNPNPMQAVPAYYPTMLRVPEVSLNYFTVPQRNACLGLNDKKSFWPRGKGLGGSSNLNVMLFQRGNPNDYNRWAELSGSDEWKFTNVLKNFKNIENYHGEYYNEKWHAKDGHYGVYVSASQEKRLSDEFLQAGQEMGYPTKDVNGYQEASFCRMDTTIKNGRRFGAYLAFLEPILNRSNLKILRYARATKIHFDKNRKAYGVTFERHGVQHFAKATKEIILSGGAIDSPKLLMLSGIGPRRHLQNLGIKSIVDLPVGENLQDHIMINALFIMNTTKTSFVLHRDLNLDLIRDYFGRRSGLLASPAISGVGYVYSAHAKERNSSIPDLQLMIAPVIPFPMSFEQIGNLQDDVFVRLMKGFADEDGFVATVALAKSYSRGTIKLASRDINEMPIIDPKYLSHPDDVRILVEGLKFIVNMYENSNAFKKYGTRLLPRHFPGCEKHEFKTDAYYECYIRQFTLTLYHPCGTCSMGKGFHDPKAVVDSRLRVLKTRGLRVVDASVIPEIPNSNLNAPVLMLADKASEMILKDWSR